MQQSLLDRLQQQNGAPLIDGDQVTFVWRGSAPAPLLVGDFTGWRSGALELAEVEPGIWARTVPLPRDAYVEYTFVYAPDIEERVGDLLNPQVIWNGVDSVNHRLMMPEYRPTDLTTRHPGTMRGTVSKHTIEAGNLLATPQRRIHFYQPPVDQPVPLVVVWDGSDYLFRARLNIIVDNLIAQGRIAPVALALVDNGRDARMSEYFCNDATVAFVIEHLLPFASGLLNLIEPAQGQYGVLGASMGGLMALYTGLRLPSVFGRVISQSGAFLADPRIGMVIDHLVDTLPTAPLKIWQDVGTLEWLLEGNRAMNARLLRTGYAVTYQEYNGGHNYTMWANWVGRGLETVYGR